MDSRDASARAPGAPSKRRIPVVCIIAAAILAAIVLALVGRHLYFRSKINAELDAIRKAGFPVTLQELSDYYPVPQGENAAVIYTQAFAKFADTPKDEDLPVIGEGRLPPRGMPLPEDMKTGISAYLAANAEALDLLHKAAAIDGCRFDLDFSRGYDIQLPHLREFRQAARLFELQAVMKAEEGKPDEAARVIADFFGTAHALRNEPLFQSQFVRMAVISFSMSTLERVLSRTILGDEQLAKISTALVSVDNPEGLLRLLVGERCQGEALVPEEMPEFNRRRIIGAWYKYSGAEAQDRAMYLKLMAELVSTAGGSPKEMREQPKKVEQESRQLPEYFVIARSYFVALPSVFESHLKALARLRAARAGIAVERFRMAKGRLPESLDELVPKWLDTIPADPFDERPIRYKKLAKGFVTYSVGPDQKDHGGIELDPKDSKAQHDITFIVAR